MENEENLKEEEIYDIHRRGSVKYLYPKKPATKYFFDGLIIRSAAEQYEMYVSEYGSVKITTLGGCPIYYTWICGPEEVEKFYELVKDMTRDEFERTVFETNAGAYALYYMLDSFDNYCMKNGIDISQEKYMD